MITNHKPQPGADLQPIDNPPAALEQPETKPPATAEEDDPAVEETEDQPS